MPRMIALKAFQFAYKPLEPGDEFDATDRESNLLRALGRAKDKPREQVNGTPSTMVRRVQRRRSTLNAEADE